MQARIAAILLALPLLAAAAVCPPHGDSPDQRLWALDEMKNRTLAPGIDSSITLEAILAPGNDRERWKDSQGAHLTGYVLLVKRGGLETANCHSASARDVHIVLGLHPKDDPKNGLIVEVTPAFQPSVGTVAQLRKLKGKRVTVDGWMFFDEEHWDNAVHTGHAKRLWRATAWEVHPVTGISPAN